MKLMSAFLLILFFQSIFSVTFSEVIINLRKLETYIKQYKTEKKSTVSLTHLITSYIREGKHTGTAWSMAGGSAPKDLHQYITQKDTEKKTNATLCRTYGNIVLPSKEKLNFVHLFAVMNGIEYKNSYTGQFSTLVGWGGDIAQLAQDLKKFNGTIDQLLVEANKLIGIKGQFGEGDLVSDLDGSIILKKKTDSVNFADIIESYYKGTEWKARVANFVKFTFPEVTDKTQLRQVIYDRYNTNSYIQMLECKYGIRNGNSNCYFTKGIIEAYKNHQKAAVYAFSDYLKKRL